MFKKSTPKVAPPPGAPSLEEMLTDIKTFKITQSAEIKLNNSDALEHVLLTEPENLSLETWWQVFDAYEQKLKQLGTVEATLGTQKEKLLEYKLKLENTAKDLCDGIQNQQTLILEAAD